MARTTNAANAARGQVLEVVVVAAAVGAVGQEVAGAQETGEGEAEGARRVE